MKTHIGRWGCVSSLIIYTFKKIQCGCIWAWIIAVPSHIFCYPQAFFSHSSFVSFLSVSSPFFSLTARLHGILKKKIKKTSSSSGILNVLCNICIVCQNQRAAAQSIYFIMCWHLKRLCFGRFIQPIELPPGFDISFRRARDYNSAH